MFSSSKLALVAVAAATLSGVDANPTVYHAPITQYPGASGTTSGCVEMSCTDAKECTFSGIVGGLPAAEVDKVATVSFVHVHDGTACTDADVGGHWETTDSTPADPWTAGPSITVASLTGTLSTAATLGAGQEHAALVGKPLVIHGPTSTNGPKLGCGLIVAGACPAAEYKAEITQYPGADGTTNGCVTISCTQPEQVCTFSGSVSGLPAAEVDIAATAGKVHVHSGTACTEADAGGHWETSDSTPADPWTAGPSITVSSLTGTLSLTATLGAGQTLTTMVGKPLVIHGPTGDARLGCGLIVAGSSCPTTTTANQDSAVAASLSAATLGALAVLMMAM